MHQKNQNKKHIPVMLSEVLRYLGPKKGESYLDLTAGYGGHAKAILEKTLNGSGATLVDRDQAAVAFLKQSFKDEQVQVIHKDFVAAAKDLLTQARQFDLILADLGVSSPQLAAAERGFSFGTKGQLDMRMDQRQELTAQTIVNSYSQVELADIIWRYGEEPKAQKIAKILVEYRPIDTTLQLADIVAKNVKKGKIHPATKVFQAIRIAVNQEIQLLQEALPLWLDLLAPEGRIAIISFHSLEDRIVKQVFREKSKHPYEATLKLLTKGPVMASREELVFNPRARSAKLRAAVKIKKQERGA